MVLEIRSVFVIVCMDIFSCCRAKAVQNGTVNSAASERANIIDFCLGFTVY